MNVRCRLNHDITALHRAVFNAEKDFMNFHPEDVGRLQQQLVAVKHDLKLALASEKILLDELEKKSLEILERKKAEEKLDAALNDLKLALASEKVLLDELDRKNKELVELSITDGLTGLYNHRFIQERCEFEFKRARRYGGNLSCLMIDIDHFKMLNDIHGHQCGDFVLRELSGILRKHSREVDICGRYGGEEFLILTNVALEYTMQFAAKLRNAINGHVFAFQDKSLHVTVSIGIADFDPGMKDRLELINRADLAMYQAKQDGRNLIRMWKEQTIKRAPVDPWGER